MAGSRIVSVEASGRGLQTDSVSVLGDSVRGALTAATCRAESKQMRWKIAVPPMASLGDGAGGTW